MKAVAVYPGKAHSVHLEELPRPQLSDVPNGRGVLVKVLKVGVDATDAEINEALYGNAPVGSDFLVLGHECFGRVEAVGPSVTHVRPGDYVTSTVRRPGGSIFDRIGRSDITTEEVYYERGINLLHGYMTEYFVDDLEYIIKVPESLKHLHVLCEPASVAYKAIDEAMHAQRRLQVWEPKTAFVLGSGQIGLLTTMILRLRGIRTFTIARSEAPNLKAEIAAAFGSTYVSTKKTSLKELAQKVGKPDLIIESTGHSGVAFEAMEILNLNGAMVWTSITGGQRSIQVPSDKINLEWVLGNKLLLGSVNSNYRHFEKAIADLGYAEQMFPGVLQRILTHPVHGLENYQKMIELLEDPSTLKVFMNVSED
ncbi:MAG: glucose 1-dehydrogenase [Verrucomicrobia bacterium]|nr:glucose 1-dehydrogenase [Verrucomicrobiota bacterium]